jgi:hypothetical protein
MAKRDAPPARRKAAPEALLSSAEVALADRQRGVIGQVLVEPQGQFLHQRLPPLRQWKHLDGERMAVGAGQRVHLRQLAFELVNARQLQVVGARGSRQGHRTGSQNAQGIGGGRGSGRGKGLWHGGRTI